MVIGSVTRAHRNAFTVLHDLGEYTGASEAVGGGLTPAENKHRGYSHWQISRDNESDRDYRSSRWARPLGEWPRISSG